MQDTLTKNDVLLQIKNEVLKGCGFEPTIAQKPVIDAFQSPYFKLLITGGWRGGKSEISSILLVLGYHLDLKATLGKRLYWIIGDSYNTCREEFGKSLAYFDKLGLLEGKAHFPSEGQCSMKLIGDVEIVTKSTDDEWKIAESAPDGILTVEAGRLTESSYYRILGRLAEKRAWCVFSGTLESSDPRAQSWYPNLYWEWQPHGLDGKSYSIPTWSNSVIFPGGRYDPTIVEYERKMPPDMFQEKFGAVPVKPGGLIMKEFSNEIHVGKFPYDDNIPVEVAIDPGYGGAYAVEFIQVRESIPYLIGEVYLQGYVTEDIIEVCKNLPYFGAVSRGVIDIAGTQHQAMPSPVEVWQKLTRISLDYGKVEELRGIEVLRTKLHVDPVTKRPKMYVDALCKGFIAECGGGQSPVHNGGAWLRDINTNKPIDRNNHATKAVIYWLIQRQGYVPYDRKIKERKSLLVERKTAGMYR